MKRNVLRVALDEIPDGGFQLSLDRSVTPFAGLLDELGADVEGSADVKLKRWPGRVDVSGALHAALELVCVRCTESYRAVLDREIWQILVEPSKQGDAEQEEEVELTSRDLDRSELDGEHVDLKVLLREELQLALPTKPLCREECKGICQKCGADWNHETCDCGPDIDPRWEALAGLKLEQD